MKICYPLFLILLLGIELPAQNNFCLTDQIWAEMVQKDSSLLFTRNSMDNAISKLSNAQAASQKSLKSLSIPVSTVIPIVIYIVHDTSASSNISMQQIQSQMDQLNQNFAPFGYTFCYAHRNVIDTSHFVPQAGDSVGVFRISSALTNLDQYTQDAQLKALSTLPSQNYLRIFVVKSISPAGVLGYAILPGGSAANDGIVMRSDVFGSHNFCQSCNLLPQYDLGAALTHECGHFLNLYHTFQGGCVRGNQPGISCQFDGDRVCDTPPTTGNFGCPSPAPFSCDSVNTELIQNYMDYTNDPCKNSFTFGQKARMDFSVMAYRPELISTANLINTGVTCVSFANQYANIYCDNYNACLNTVMTLTSLNSSGFTYHWNFGDGDSAIGTSVTHSYTTAGQFLLTLNAVNTSQNISATQNITVFITACNPIACGFNKWDAKFSYLDFSSGTPIATNHPGCDPHGFPEFFALYYRADNLGNPLFHFITDFNLGRIYNQSLLDTSFQVADSVIPGYSTQILPVNGTPGKYCVVSNKAFLDSNTVGVTDTIIYTYIQAANGTVHTIPGKRAIIVPVPAGGYFYTGTSVITSVPNCDGTKFWVIAYLQQGLFAVYEMNSNDTVFLHQTFTIPNMGQCVDLVASPNGRKIAAGVSYINNGHKGVYILDFDKGSGNILSYKLIDEGLHTVHQYNASQATRMCFSPNSRFIYLTDLCCDQQYGNIGNLYQADLYSADPWAGRKSIYQFQRDDNEQSPGIYYYNGPDNKMYVGGFYQPGNSPAGYRLGVINFPNVAENGLNSTGYNNNGPYIKPHNSPYSNIMNITAFEGLADKPEAYGCGWQPNPPPTFVYYATGCNSYQFHTDDCYTHSWNFGDVASGAANASVFSEPLHNFSGPGNYAVTLTANGLLFTDTIRISAPPIALAASPITGCTILHANYSIASQLPGVSYNWNITNGIPPFASQVPGVDVQWNTGGSSGQIKVVAFDTITGCIDSASFNIIIAGSSNLEATIHHLGGDTLTTANYVSYQWLLNGNTIPNATHQIYNATQNGFYQVIVTDVDGCKDTAAAVQIINTVAEASGNVLLRIYPNPNSGALNLELSQISDPQIYVALYDVLGNLVFVNNFDILQHDFSTSLNLGKYANGIYSLRITSTHFQTTRKIILAK